MKAFLLIAVMLAAVAAQDLHDLPAFPRLAEVDSSAAVVVSGPENDILNGKPLKVPIIVDPFAQEPGSDAAQTLDRITSVLTMEPPSAQQPKPSAADSVDILEVLDNAAKNDAKAAKAKAGAKAKAAANAASKGDLKNMAAVKAEIAGLQGMIKKALDIEKELPTKRARLERLKKKLHSAAAGAAKKLAGKKAGAQAKVAGDVSKKIQTLKDKLAKLESAKKLLHKSIDGLKKVASGAAVSPALIEEVEQAM